MWCFNDNTFVKKTSIMFFVRYTEPVWAVGFALEQTLRDATLAVFSFLILKRLRHKLCDQFYLILLC
ncbi:MAG: hypothetical protein LBH59_08875 [Planctomycetaceae bacterium]|nr:hypothetical protein [Planctomycetaceae bacterium]